MVKVEPFYREGLARAYAKHFDAAELAEINAFFATPTGNRYAATSMGMYMDPQLMAEIPDMMPVIVGHVAEAATRLPGGPYPRSAATRMGDVDNDGDLDIFAAGGYAVAGPPWGHLFLNDGTGHFEEVADPFPPTISGTNIDDVELFDADRDFDLDIAVNAHQGGIGALWRDLRAPGTALARLSTGVMRNVLERNAQGEYLLPRVTPRSTLNRRINAQRRVATQQFSQRRIERLADAADCTLNAVLAYLCGTVLRRFFKEFNALPEESLIGLVPVGLRTDVAGLSGNTLPLGGTAVGDLGIAESERPTDVVSAVGTVLDANRAIATTALALGLVALLLPSARARGRWGIAVFGVLQLTLVLAWAPTIPWPGFVLGTWLLCGILVAAPYLGTISRRGGRR